jgi:CRP-like cAMP-binding protein
VKNSTSPISNEKRSALRIFWGQIRGSERNQTGSDKIKLLKKIAFFENLNKFQLEQVAQYIYEREYNENEFVFEVGQPGAALFIVLSGEVSIEIPNSSGPNTILAILNKLSFFGELALLDESPRSASCRAVVPTKVLALFRKDLEQIAKSNPDISSKIFKSLAIIVGNRLKATNDFIEKRLKVAA